MKFRDYFSSGEGPVLSFEVFPPRSDAAAEQLERALPRLLALKPTYMTVTYGAFGSNQERTLEIAAAIKSEHGVETASHLTCVGHSRAELDGILERLERSGIENIVALRGDPPHGEVAFVAPPGGFKHASELVAHIRAEHDFGLAVAGYPEKHIEAPDFETDLRNLKRKVDAGGDIVITQLFYDNADYYRFVDEARRIGVRVPIVPGLLPIQSFGQIKRITALCGSKIPPALHDELEAAEEDPEAVKHIGARWAVEQARELLDRGAPGIHFYVLNRAQHMERIFEELFSARARKRARARARGGEGKTRKSRGGITCGAGTLPGTRITTPRGKAACPSSFLSVQKNHMLETAFSDSRNASSHPGSAHLFSKLHSREKKVGGLS